MEDHDRLKKMKTEILAREAKGKGTPPTACSARPDWWPPNPYPEWLFPMTTAEYAKSIPNHKKRTAISGCIARFAWEIASQMIFERMTEAQNAKM